MAQVKTDCKTEYDIANVISLVYIIVKAKPCLRRTFVMRQKLHWHYNCAQHKTNIIKLY